MRLFERVGKAEVRLTAAGRQLYDHAAPFFAWSRRSTRPCCAGAAWLRGPSRPAEVASRCVRSGARAVRSTRRSISRCARSATRTADAKPMPFAHATVRRTPKRARYVARAHQPPEGGGVGRAAGHSASEPASHGTVSSAEVVDAPMSHSAKPTTSKPQPRMTQSRDLFFMSLSPFVTTDVLIPESRIRARLAQSRWYAPHGRSCTPVSPRRCSPSRWCGLAGCSGAITSPPRLPPSPVTTVRSLTPTRRSTRSTKPRARRPTLPIP